MSQSRFKKALVTGGAGFIGSHIAEALLREGIETLVIDNLSTGKRENVPQGAEFLEGDIRDERLLSLACPNVDIIFHEAAVVSIRASMEKFLPDADTNVMGTLCMLKAAARAGIKKFVFASSMAVYGNGLSLPIEEENILDPLSPYGVGKLASEKYIRQLGDFFGFSTACLRYFNTYGPRQTFTPYVGVITIFITKMLKNESPVIFGDGEQVRDFICVEDVARANILAMEADTPHLVCNIGTGTGTSVNEIFTLLKETLDFPGQAEYVPARAGEPGSSIADTKRADQKIGFTARCRLEDNMEDVIRWNRRLL